MGNETTKKTIIIVLSVIATMYLGACLSKIFSSANYGNYPSYYAKEKSEKNIYKIDINTNTCIEIIMAMVEGKKNDKKNKGLILQIDDYGGPAFACSEVYDKIMSYKKETGRPVYVYIGERATGGAFFVAMAADYIFANKTSVVGGVDAPNDKRWFEQSPYTEKIYSSEAASTELEISEASNKQIEMLEVFKTVMLDQFISAIVENRKIDRKLVEEFADGRFFTVSEALGKNLIDEIGVYDDCVAKMREIKGLKKVKVTGSYYR